MSCLLSLVLSVGGLFTDVSHCEWPAKYGNECGELAWLIFCTAELEILLVFEDLILTVPWTAYFKDQRNEHVFPMRE